MLYLAAPINALARLQASLQRCQHATRENDPAVAKRHLADLIQDFQRVHAKFDKALRRYLMSAGVVDVNSLTHRELIEVAARRGVVRDPAAWLEFEAVSRIATDPTRHAELCDVMARFADEAQWVLDELVKRSLRS